MEEEGRMREEEGREKEGRRGYDASSNTGANVTIAIIDVIRIMDSCDFALLTPSFEPLDFPKVVLVVLVVLLIPSSTGGTGTCGTTDSAVWGSTSSTCGTTDS